ncbi:hypothetical protein [Mycolicibacterium obuense]|uniref:Uncharacterized protein n=1 Tax=Mycolicibacterium obuense TaxID=1807 RepID=A0A0M2JUU4_9MYCO|nr:hypothetical protein [Mycolicibacterium obuense]KKE98558.1 hypothetical protein WN67_28615 [Mycolicibacterium obuense]OKH65511.1 hypothetical protein EB72_06760 [Mycobacterium sp. SWH-M1]
MADNVIAFPTASDGDGARDAVFAMDPDATLRELARSLFTMQQTVTSLQLGVDALHADPSPEPDNAAVLADLTERIDGLHREVVPTVAAAMKVAVEFYDTFGPGYTVIDDPVEAAIWNNKYFVWNTDLCTRTTT